MWASSCWALWPSLGRDLAGNWLDASASPSGISSLEASGSWRSIYQGKFHGVHLDITDQSWIVKGELDTASWSLYGLVDRHDFHPVVTNSSLSLHALSPGTTHHIGGRIGSQSWAGWDIGDRDGAPQGSLSAGLGGQDFRIQANGFGETVHEHWLFLKPSASDSLAAGWHSLRYGGGSAMTIATGQDLELHGDLQVERFRPRDASDWCLGDSGAATQWTFGAIGHLPAGSLGGEISMRTAQLTTLGWHQDDDQRRIFHQELWQFAQKRAQLRWNQGAWNFEGGAERTRLELSHAENGNPFLSWNALDGSAWAPLLSVMESRSDFLTGTFTLRRAWAELSRKTQISRLETKLTLRLEDDQAKADFRWHQRDAVFLFLSSQLDTTNLSVHMLLLRPELEIAWPILKPLQFTAGGNASLPLWSRHAGGQAASSGSESGPKISEASSGGWQLHAGFVWRI